MIVKKMALVGLFTEVLIKKFEDTDLVDV